MSRRVEFLGLVLGLLIISASDSGAVEIEWVYVGDPGNAPDAALNCFGAECGSVPYGYYIAKFEITNAQYAEFLNAKAAATDPFSLYNPGSGGIEPSGITQNGTSGSYTYTVRDGFADKPTTFVSFYAAVRFVNWLSNGQGNGDTETGAYSLLGGTLIPSNGETVQRNLGATIFLPSENEWYKAAYYDGMTATYFDYPTGSDTPVTCSLPTAAPNRANCFEGPEPFVGATTNKGAYTGSASPYGTFDQGGNAKEWTEQIVGGGRANRGGGWTSAVPDLVASYRNYSTVDVGLEAFGFRVASLAVCGNGQVEQGEECDDGNVMNGDGCTSTCTTEPCRNGLDDDSDGLVDYPADPGCANPGSSSESPACNNGLDDDGDNLTDFPADPGCRAASSTSEAPECDDGIDNDGDGKKDIADSGCYAGDAADRSEKVDCGDGIDNDGDGLIDTADPGCLDSNWPSEDPACSDGADNDGDGSIDWLGNAGVPADPQCAGSPFGFTEKPPPPPGGCGLGAELVLVLFAIQRRIARTRLPERHLASFA